MTLRNPKGSEPSPQELSLEREFLRSVTFWKPDSVINDDRLMQNSGLPRGKATFVVYSTFIASFAVLLGFAAFVLTFFKAYTNTLFGLLLFILSGLFVMYVAHYFMAKTLTRHFRENL